MLEIFTKESADKTAEILRDKFGVVIKNNTADGPSSGGSGSGSSGSSGNPSSGSGSSGGSGGNTGSHGSRGQGDDNGDKKKILKTVGLVLIAMAIGSLIAGMAIVYNVRQNSTDEGRKQLKFLVEKRNEEKKWEHEKTMKQLELKRQRLASQRESSPVITSPTPDPVPSSSSDCVTPKEMGTRREPFRLAAGSCLVREAAREHFWLALQSEPRKVTGDATFNEIVPKYEEGKVLPDVRDTCTTYLVPDNCLSYLKGKLGVSQSVTNSSRLEISTH